MSAQRAAQLVEAGVWLQATGDQDGARRLFEQALKLDPDNARARQFLGLRAPVPAPPKVEPLSEPAPPPIPTGTIPYTQSSPTLILGSPPIPDMELEVAVDEPEQVPADQRPTLFDAPPGMASKGLRLAPGWDEDATPPPDSDGPLELTPATALSLKIEATLRDGPPPHVTSAWDSASDPGFLLHATPPPSRAPFKEPLDLVTENHTPLPMKMPTASQAIKLKEELAILIHGAKDLQDLDDHTGAMELLKKALELDPMHGEAVKLRERSEKTLLAIYESKLGGMDAVPKVVLKSDEIIWLNLDHRAGFVLAQIDGGVTYDDLFAICGMSRLDTARILAQLKDEGVIRS